MCRKEEGDKKTYNSLANQSSSFKSSKVHAPGVADLASAGRASIVLRLSFMLQGAGSSLKHLMRMRYIILSYNTYQHQYFTFQIISLLDFPSQN